MSKFKLGLDIHGVIDANPEFFSKLSHMFKSMGYEVHILTGHSITIKLIKQLLDLNIHYTHLFSITDYHANIGTSIEYEDSENPWIEDELWNKTKAEYCRKYKISMMIDDSEDYGQYFDKENVYVRYENNGRA